MNNTEKKYLTVEGVRLPYTVRGVGSLLLLIPGGEGGGDGYEALAEALTGQFTVVYYDRRGAPGSRLDDPDADVRLETHSEDAHRLLAALTDEPAFIFGSSAGALIGLDLVIHHPEQVRTLVAHEPPVEGILPEFDRGQAEIAEALHQGDMQALAKLGSQINLRFDDLEPGGGPSSPRPARCGSAWGSLAALYVSGGSPLPLKRGGARSEPGSGGFGRRQQRAGIAGLPLHARPGTAPGDGDGRVTEPSRGLYQLSEGFRTEAS